MDVTDFWQTSLAATLGAFLINRVQNSMAETRRAVGVMRAMLLDIEKMERDSRVFIDTHKHAVSMEPPRIFTPAQRMMTAFLDDGLKSLGQGKWVPMQGVRLVHELFATADEANRCLDRLQELAVNVETGPHLLNLCLGEASRVAVKCENIIRQAPEVRAALNEAIAEHDWLSDP